MSKRKPDQVVEFRISLQDKEREMFDSVVGAYQVDKISEAVDQALSFQNVYLGITLIEIATGKEILFGTPNDLNDLIADVRTWWAANKDEFGPGVWAFIKRLIERAPLTPAQQAAREQLATYQQTLYTTEPGINPETGETWTSVGQMWAASFGVSIP